MANWKVVAAAGLLICVSTASAAPASELSWEGEAACPDREPLLFELERALGKSLSEAGHLIFHIGVESTGSRVRARLSVRDPDGGGAPDERVLVAGSCSELTDTLAVAMSLAIGRSELEPEPEPPAVAPIARPPEPALPPAGRVDGDRLESAAAQAEGGLRASAAALLVADVGSLPHPALGAGVGVELSWSRLRALFGALLFYPQQTSFGSGGSLNADVALTVATARGCMPLHGDALHSVSIPVCLGLELGRMEGVGHGLPTTHTREVLWIAPRAELGLAWALPETPLRFETSLGALLPLNRDEFVFRGFGIVHQPSRLAGRLGASFSLTFD